MIDFELFVYGIIPMILGIIILFKSFQITKNQKKLFDWILFFGLLLSTLFAEYILLVIFFKDAWPTFLPHILIIANLLMLLYQIYNRKK